MKTGMWRICGPACCFFLYSYVRDKIMRMWFQFYLQLNGLNARIVQHEVDHLDGKLYVDRVEG
ncbi:peptide deformylase [Patescibacteria group bacterium]|nr:peptide deformylase [Patescibacteria group bacterium]MBU1953403.1 peptide deformylase [Patescibacteria group bacterium]